MKKYVIIPAFLISCYAGSSGAQVAIIAHKSVPTDTITRNALLDFYALDIKKWHNGNPVVVKDLQQKGEVRTLFYDYLRKSPSRMKSIWLKKMLSGESDPPEALTSEAQMLKTIASTPGAIGFIAESNVQGDVKRLLVIRKGEK